MKKKKQQQYSINQAAEKICGKRQIEPGMVMFDEPAELGYHCPVCKYKQIAKGNYDERLHWSEYNDFLWCEMCNKDYPSALCQPNIDKAVEIFLLSVRDQKIRYKQEILSELFEEIKHGDEDHQKWLKKKLDNFKTK